MCHRQFIDDDGSVWAVWDVHPARIWESIGTSKASPEHPSPPLPHRECGGPIEHSLASGWLCFESGERKLRLAPIPADWEALGSSDLMLLLNTATVVNRPKPVIRLTPD